MRRALLMCSLALLLAASPAAAQVPNEADKDPSGGDQELLKNPPKRYSLSDIGETRTQRERRLQRENARSLIFQKASNRAKQREERIAFNQAHGISHSRPTSRPLQWFGPNWWALPRVVHIHVSESPEPSRDDDYPSPRD